MRAVCLSLAALLLASAQGSAQSWQEYSPPGGSFSVELPAPLRKVMSFGGEHGASLERDQKNRWATSYAAIETTPEDCRFGIVVITAQQRFIQTQPRDELYWYLGAILIGNEDEAEPTSVKEIDVNELKGREYIYTHGGVFTRGRIFETGGKIYVVVFVGGKADDLTSADAERFFSSFRRRSQKKKVKVPNSNRANR